MKSKVDQMEYMKHGSLHDLEHRLVLLNMQFKKHQKENDALKFGVSSQTASLMKELDIINHYREQQNVMEKLICKYKKEIRKQSKPSLLQSKFSIELRSLQEEQLHLKKKIVLKNNVSRKLDKKNTNMSTRGAMAIAEKDEILMLRALNVFENSVISQKKIFAYDKKCKL